MRAGHHLVSANHTSAASSAAMTTASTKVARRRHTHSRCQSTYTHWHVTQAPMPAAYRSG